MSRDMIRLMHALFLPGAASCREGFWCPAADVYRTADGWLVKFDLAGVRPEDFHLEVEGCCLTLRGRRRDAVAEAGYRHYQMEIAYSYFERRLELPCKLDRAAVSTDYRDGMLLVHFRTEEAQP